MNLPSPRMALGILVAMAAALPAAAQNNTVPGTDVALGILGDIDALGRQGGFPNGMNALSMATTSCNFGTVNVPWFSPMQENHPLIAFMVTRETNGRLTQISDRSFLKHGFFALSDSQCIPCQNPSQSGNFLGVGCSDTYGIFTNGDNFFLGPADEIDPWLGTWTAQCSFFDMGSPPVGAAQQCDGNRSLSFGQAANLGPVGNRIRVPDSELNTSGTFYYQGHYIVRGEPLAARGNNLSSREMTANFNGNTWNVNGTGTKLDGSILQRWSGANVVTESNGNNEGQVAAAALVTNPSNGTWHYEYGFHNIDNNRAFDEIRIPIGTGTVISNFGFHDVDGDAGNDWNMTQTSNELIISMPGGSDNALRWNTIYNVWFDANVAPETATIEVDQFMAGPGAGFIPVDIETPGGDAAPLVYCSPKISSAFCVNLISTSDLDAQPVSGANDYTVDAIGVQGFKNGLVFAGLSGPAALPFSGGTLCVQPPTKRGPVQNSLGSGVNTCDGSYSVTVNDGGVIPFGLDGGAGNSAWYQWWYRDPANGAGNLGTALSDGVQLDFQ